MASALTSKNLVKDVMSKNVYMTTPDAPLSDALALMAKAGIQRLPVCDEKGKLVGIVSDRDMRLAVNSPFLGQKAEIVWNNLTKHHIKDIMRHSVVTIEDTAPIVEAAKLMRVSNIGGLPVLDSNNTVVGILTRTDLLDHLIRLYEPIEERK